MKRLRKGEYDLANISLIGYDPISGRSYDQCHDEWSAALEDLQAYTAETRWWQIRRQIKMRWRTFVMAERFGVPPGFLG